MLSETASNLPATTHQYRQITTGHYTKYHYCTINFGEVQRRLMGWGGQAMHHALHPNVSAWRWARIFLFSFGIHMRQTCTTGDFWLSYCVCDLSCIRSLYLWMFFIEYYYFVFFWITEWGVSVYNIDVLAWFLSHVFIRYITHSLCVHLNS